MPASCGHDRRCEGVRCRPVPGPGGPEVLLLLWWIPLSPTAGFLLAGAFLSESWPSWQVVPLALLLAAPFAVGAVYGYRAFRRHDRAGLIGLIVHAAMVVVAIVMPISESLNR